MPSRSNPDDLCKEIAGELRDIAGWLACGQMTPERYRLAVVSLEARKVARFGFRLSSAISEDQTAHFTLRFTDTGELCASIDVDPATGELTIQHTCV